MCNNIYLFISGGEEEKNQNLFHDQKDISGNPACKAKNFNHFHQLETKNTSSSYDQVFVFLSWLQIHYDRGDTLGMLPEKTRQGGFCPPR